MKEIYNSAKICPFSHSLPSSSMDPNQNKPFTGYSQMFSDTKNFRGSNIYGDESSYNRYSAQGQYPQQFGNRDDEQSYCDMQLDPEISRILAHSRIERELIYVWKGFREKTGPRLKNKFMRYVQLANQAARLNGIVLFNNLMMNYVCCCWMMYVCVYLENCFSGFADAGEQMRSQYEEQSFQESLQEVYNQLQPLYKQLFTYVRRKLVQKYGEQNVRPDGPIPAHLLGDLLYEIGIDY